MTEIFLWIAVTTIYGFLTYKMGESQGVKAFSEIIIKAGVVESKAELYRKLLEFSESLNEED